MSRKRFITSDMSVDEKIAEIAAENPVAALMWPWFITGFDDWGRMEANPVKIKLSIFPAFPYTPKDIEEAIDLYDKFGIVHKYEVDGKEYIAIEPEKYYKYQTYIRGSKREIDGSNCPPPPNPPWGKAKDSTEKHTEHDRHADARTCAQSNADERKCIPSPSPSPSINKDNDDNNMAAQPIGFVACFEQEFGRPISPSEFERLYAFLANDGMDDAVVCEAIRRARANGVPKLTYVEAILREWRDNQVVNLAGVERVDKEFEKRKGVKKVGTVESQARALDANGGGGAKKSKYPVLHVIDGKEFYG